MLQLIHSESMDEYVGGRGTNSERDMEKEGFVDGYFLESQASAPTLMHYNSSGSPNKVR